MSKHRFRAVLARRRLLGVVAVAAVGGVCAACGVKGPLYLPEPSEDEQKKDKDDDNVSQRPSAPDVVALG